MEINNEIKKILNEYKIFEPDALVYLLSLYFELSPTYIPDFLKQKINITKIVEMESTGLKWNIPLFEGQETAFDWVKTEYINLFSKVNKAGYVKESTIRMKKLFSKNPDIRKDDVLGGTKMYLMNTDEKFVRLPHYFIEKGRGVEKTSDLLEWIEKYRLNIENQKQFKDQYNILM